MRTVIGILIATAIVAFYCMFGRELLKGTTWGCKFLTWIEPIEIALWRKSETLLWARFRMLMGALLSCLLTVGAIDLTPFIIFLPEEHQGLARNVLSVLPLVTTIVAMVDEKLRRTTKKPLEVVELPSNASPEMRQIAENVENVAATAVADVRAARAEGKL